MDESCLAKGGGVVRVPQIGGAHAKLVKLAKVAAAITMGGTATLRPTISDTARKAIARALREGRHITVNLAITIADAVARPSAAVNASASIKRLLERGQLAVLCESLDGGHLCAVVRDRERQAGIDAEAVQQHGAGTALTMVAPFMAPISPVRSRSTSSAKRLSCAPDHDSPARRRGMWAHD